MSYVSKYDAKKHYENECKQAEARRLSCLHEKTQRIIQTQEKWFAERAPMPESLKNMVKALRA